MSFINEYTPKDLQWRSSGIFPEKNESFIYAAGHTDKDPVVLKSDLKGNTIWAMSISLTEAPMRFYDLIQLAATNEPQYVLTAYDGVRFFLISFNHLGKTLWVREVLTKDDDIHAVMAPVPEKNGFYFVYSDKNDIDENPQPNVLLIKGDGTIARQVQLHNSGIEHNGFIVNTAGSHKEGLTVAGRLVSKDSIGIVIELDQGLVPRGGWLYNKITIQDLLVQGSGKYIATAYSNELDGVVLLPEGMPGDPNAFLLPDSNHSHGKLALGPKGYYVSLTRSHEGVLHFLDGNHNILWTKRLSEGGSHPGIRRLQYSPATKNLVFVTKGVHVLGYTPGDLDSCLTQILKRKKTILNQVSSGRAKPFTRPVQVVLSLKKQTLKPFQVGFKDLCGDPGEGPGDPREFKPQPFMFLQTPHLYLQGAGSKGMDSTEGIHLRWMLRNSLQHHLPKANYASTNANFNRPDDYVRIYRAPYKPEPFFFSFSDSQVIEVLDPSRTWTFRAGKDFLLDLVFLDAAQYDRARQQVDVNDIRDFMGAYGPFPIELSTPLGLSFAVTLEYSGIGPGSDTEVELLSVEGNEIIAPKVVSVRRKEATATINGKQLVAENIRSVRLRNSNAELSGISFEFYEAFLMSTVEQRSWEYLGQYALTKSTNLAFNRLEPVPNSVNGKWLRFNDDAFVNIANYKKRWNDAGLPQDERIVDVVDKYITLSDNAANPDAIEFIPINVPASAATEPDYDPSDSTYELSNLFVLLLAAQDYHIARMLGLGILDLDVKVMTNKWMYLAEYITEADLNDGRGQRLVQHVYMTVPTATFTERLPLSIDLEVPVPGFPSQLDSEVPFELTDADGYSHDGRSRFIGLYHKPLHQEIPGAPFWASNHEFSTTERTFPVNAGIEYRKMGAATWRKPELAFDSNYSNLDTTVPADQRYETRPIQLPEDGNPLFVHREKESGWHDYSSYGINWFSRATMSLQVWSIETTIQVANDLQPPTSINAVLVQEEQPLLLTSQSEQEELGDIVGADKTLVRLTFDYNHGQELISYHKEIDGQIVEGFTELPDGDELFADDLELFFRSTAPNTTSGKVIAVNPGPNDLLVRVQTDRYVFVSQEDDPDTGLPNSVAEPEIPAVIAGNYVGGVLSVDGVNYVIHQISISGSNPEFILYKADENGASASGATDRLIGDLNGPPMDSLFIAVENMLNPSSWGGSNPGSMRVNIDHTTVHREEIVEGLPDGTSNTYLNKFRGILRTGTITKVMEDHDGDELDGADPGDTPKIHQGLYRIEFNAFALAHHSQWALSGQRVEFRNGIVRIHTSGDPNGPRKILKVIRTENIGTAADLVLFAFDPSFSTDPGYDAIPTGNRSVNYYPGYKVYLLKDNAWGLTAANVLPAGNEDVRYTIWGLRSRDTALNYVSPISSPALMFAQAIREPLQPRLPVGGTYATRPDFYGKATYTFTTEFDHEPYSAQYLRGSDVQILSALFERDPDAGPGVWTVSRIQNEIFDHGADVWFNDRWRNLIGFDYSYPADPAGNGQFEELDGVRLPLPNNPEFVAAINAFVDSHNDFFGTSVPNIGSITSLHQVVIPLSPNNAELRVEDFVRQVVHNCFVPLTEIPVIYEYVKDKNYLPTSEKQVIRDGNGELLKPTSPRFKMAPMMKRIGPDASAVPPKVKHETQFTDFNIDGASRAHYFYVAREFNKRMKAGPHSPILGPVHLVNAAPPRQPEIVKVTPVLENRITGTSPAIQLRFNSYPENQGIVEVQIYRATRGLDAQSVRTMSLVKEVTVEDAGGLAATTWLVEDDFSDLGYVPYGDPLFYQVTVTRAVSYNDRLGNPVQDVVPSQPSKMTVTNIVETYHPETPRIEYYSQPLNAAGELVDVTLAWDKTVHNGAYHLYQLNSERVWIEIAKVQSNDARVVVQLAATAVGSNTLKVEDNGKSIYHQFKVVAINFAGMKSQEDRMLTIHQPGLWQDISGL